MELIQLCIWKLGLDILHVNIQLNSMLKLNGFKRLLNPTNAFWKDL